MSIPTEWNFEGLSLDCVFAPYFLTFGELALPLLRIEPNILIVTFCLQICYEIDAQTINKKMTCTPTENCTFQNCNTSVKSSEFVGILLRKEKYCRTYSKKKKVVLTLLYCPKFDLFRIFNISSKLSRYVANLLRKKRWCVMLTSRVKWALHTPKFALFELLTFGLN